MIPGIQSFIVAYAILLKKFVTDKSLGKRKISAAKCDGACVQPQHLGSTGCWISVSFNLAHLDSEAQDSQGYIQRLCLNKEIQRKKKKNIDLRTPVFALKPFDLI